MSIFGWIMLALGLFLMLYTVAFLVRPAGNKGRDTLGCGFVLLAGLVWSFALARYLGSWNAGMRLGFGAVLVLPALAAIFKGGRGRIVPASISLIAAVLLASSAIPALKERVRPSAARSEAMDITKGVETLRAQIQKREQHLAELNKDTARLTAEIKALRIEDFDAAMSDPEARRVIEELAEVKRLRAAASAALTKERQALKKLQSELRSVERRAEAESLAREEMDVSDLADLPGEEEVTSPATVEDHAAREDMRALFEEARD